MITMDKLEEEEEELLLLWLLLLSRENVGIKRNIGNICRKRKEIGDFDQIHMDFSDAEFRYNIFILF